MILGLGRVGLFLCLTEPSFLYCVSPSGKICAIIIKAAKAIIIKPKKNAPNDNVINPIINNIPQI